MVRIAWRLMIIATKLTVLLATIFVHYVASQKCLLGWEQFGNSCYSFGMETVTWIDAMQYCQMYGAHLVHINDPKEDEFIVSSMKGRGMTAVWTGGSERLHRGSWEWLPSREPLGRFANWEGQEPYGVDEDCMVIDSSVRYRWIDNSCTLSHKYICEMKVPQS